MVNAPRAANTSDLIYTPATRGNIGVLIMIAGASGSGKTKSALRIATGLANGGPIYLCDTQHGRARIYADEFVFQQLELKEPFNPARFEAAAVIAQKAGSSVWICDSFSDEHIGPGGLLDMAEAELQRMTNGDFNKRDALKYTSWIAPKMEHKHMLQRLWQLNCHIILCCHAEKKLDLIKVMKNNREVTVPNPDAGVSAVCSPDIPFAMTGSFILDAKRPGVPAWLKHLDKWDPLIRLDRPFDEETGRRIGAWARGEKQSAAPAPAARQAARPVERPVEQENPDPDAEHQQPPPPASADGGLFPGDLPLKEEAPRAKSKGAADKNETVLAELIRQFRSTETRKDHHDIVDLKANRDRIMWFKKNKPDMHMRLREALEDSWARTGKQEAA